MTKLTLSRIERHAEELILQGQGSLEKFSKSFAENPAYAFEWSHDAFRAAARVQVGMNIRAWVKYEEASAEKIMDQVRRQVLHGAQYPERSTSMQSNIIKQEIVAVWAELLAKEDY